MEALARVSSSTISELYKLRGSLNRAIERDRSKKWQLSLWSKFVRFRDGGCCVNCGSAQRVQAHHIIRKVLYPHGALETGNGISLCWPCHKQIHAEFNRRPNLSLPLGAEQGDDQDEWSYLFGLLKDDAQKRGLTQDEFYHLNDQMLAFFVSVQGYEQLLELVVEGTMSRIRFAHEVWRIMPEPFYSNFISEFVRLNISSIGR
ncbi:HNH endonuclease [Halomonas daqingensis]|uniref:HNH endonuclease n=1 Tax=Billgrantia desiderata TaxID=52021 RepID=UPI001F1AAA01|nr:HNH endonuclease [Halomonas desiderata]MCE8027699.1 HNH endonuclease [Halomonas desiderata]